MVETEDRQRESRDEEGGWERRKEGRVKDREEGQEGKTQRG